MYMNTTLILDPANIYVFCVGAPHFNIKVRLKTCQRSSRLLLNKTEIS